MSEQPMSLAESVRRMKEFKEACSHSYSSWEYNPMTFIYTRRCPRCGKILETMTRQKMDNMLESENSDGS